MIEAKNITKQYKMGTTTVHALRGVSLKINKGDFVIIVGPSGSGKSTLMHILGALDHPTSGSVHIGGRNISVLEDWHLAMIRREKIGFVFQAFNLIPTLNALENVIIPTEPTNRQPEEVAEKAKALLRQMGLGERMFHKPTELSGGERQRVSIARSLINNPEIIFADEPTGNLDSATGDKIVREMRRLNKEENKTFVIVTHDEDLLRYATRQYHLKDGKIDSIRSKSRVKK
ncbi:MAG: ABC transporter ATP-binding protein [Candidatus Diapherotrites archaeon]|nr:ABC transporter ATP-binding protein [Candidatus Micrarchaeota archaeon]MBU1939457.1 ABC transporter ATP-binding protein [Candidatus Micrarchaeota archaeon]